jgi:YfiH family protein
MLKPRLSPMLSSIPGLSHGFFTRQGGVSTGPFESLNGSSKYGDCPKAVSENCQAIQDHLQGTHLVSLIQVHGTHIIPVLGPCEKPQKGDGLLTHTPGVMVGVLTADCVPLLWACPQSQRVAAIHSGWRGTLGGIVEKARELFSSPPYVAIGPAIQQASFEVGLEVYEDFCHKDSTAGQFFLPCPEKKTYYLFDLPGYIYDTLGRLKVREIDWIQENTYSAEDIYFSYRRSTHRHESAFGCQVSAIGWQAL